MKIKDVFEKTLQFFKDKKIESARLDTELLLAFALKIERVQIYIRYELPLSETEIQLCRELVRRRASGEPIAYITGEKGFFGETFSVGPGVLIPRPETELLVEQALEFIKKREIKNPKILDLGAGTGCIGFSILKNCAEATLVAVEKSNEAFEYLYKNQKNLKLEERSKILIADASTVDLQSEMFDIVVANPPYIAGDDPQVEAAVRKFEPHSALYADNNGLKALKEWAAHSQRVLKKPGLMLFEMGHQQGAPMLQFFSAMNLFSEVKVLKDLSGLDRVIKSLHT
jgi:release factor glutamine methyltransferase